MPSLDEIKQKRYKKFIKKPYRIWDLTGEKNHYQPAYIQNKEESSLFSDNKSVNADSLQLFPLQSHKDNKKEPNDQTTTRQRSDNNKTTQEQQSDNNKTTIEQLIDNKETTNGQQQDNEWTKQPPIKSPAALTFFAF